MATINQAKHTQQVLRRVVKYIESAVNSGVMTQKEGEKFINKLQVRTLIVPGELTIGDAGTSMKMVENGDFSIDKNDMVVTIAEAMAYRLSPTSGLIFKPSATTTLNNSIFWNGQRSLTIGSSKVFHKTANLTFSESGVVTEFGSNFREMAVNYILSGQSSITADFKGIGLASKVKAKSEDSDQLVYLVVVVVIEGAAKVFGFGTDDYAVLPMY